MKSVRLPLSSQIVVGSGGNVDALLCHEDQVARGDDDCVFQSRVIASGRAEIQADQPIGHDFGFDETGDEILGLVPNLVQIDRGRGDAAHFHNASPSHKAKLDARFYALTHRKVAHYETSQSHDSVSAVNHCAPEHGLNRPAGFPRNESGAVLSCVTLVPHSGSQARLKSTDAPRRDPTKSSVPQNSAELPRSSGLSKRLRSLRILAGQQLVQPSGGYRENTSRRQASSQPCSLKSSNETEHESRGRPGSRSGLKEQLGTALAVAVGEAAFPTAPRDYSSRLSCFPNNWGEGDQ
jgi:hypothetical protein